MNQFVERDGIKIGYDTAGRGGPGIVFVHGWACDRTYFAPQFKHFAARHRVAALDLRGHGMSDRPEPGPGVYEIDTFADDVLAVAAAAGYDRPIVIGHSLGGVTALACAVRAGMVRAAVMVDPAPLVNPAIKAFIGEAADAVANDHNASWRTTFVSGMFLPSDTARRAEIIAGMAALPPPVAAAALRAIQSFDGVAALGAVDVPLLTIGSASPADVLSEVRAACPSITIGQTVGSGHFNQLEVPDQVNAMIERFLAINPSIHR
jgi:pimeloyl-ACP methyl ester carboxylesterase